MLNFTDVLYKRRDKMETFLIVAWIVLVVVSYRASLFALEKAGVL